MIEDRDGLTRAALLRRSALGAGLFLGGPALLAACGGSSSSSSASSLSADASSVASSGSSAVSSAAAGASTAAEGAVSSATAEASTAAAAGGLEALIAAAKQEGKLNTIALPPEWANYKEVMATFQQKYGITISNASPEASSAEENQAVKSLGSRSNAPDVLDVGPSFAAAGVEAKLYQPYQNSQWATIPDTMKDAAGMWVGDYWGVVSFGVNTDVVKTAPKTWKDLNDPGLKGKVALNDDPRKAAAAFGGVIAAAIANGGSVDNIQPGIDFFAELKKNGNFVLSNVTPATVASGATPIAIDWDYNNLSAKTSADGKFSFDVSVPTGSNPYGNFYCQAINADANHPNASKLWQEFLYSDEGQLLFLKGFAHPARFAAMTKAGTIPASALQGLPDASLYDGVVFATQAQLANATKQLLDGSNGWGAKVAGA